MNGWLIFFWIYLIVLLAGIVVAATAARADVYFCAPQRYTNIARADCVLVPVPDVPWSVVARRARPHYWGRRGAYQPAPGPGIVRRVELRGGRPMVLWYRDGREVMRLDHGPAVQRR
jgi:hypothetical protein